MAGEGGASGGGGGSSIAAVTYPLTEEGKDTTLGGYLSKGYLGRDIHREQQEHKRHVQQKRVAWWTRQAELAVLAARSLAAPERPALGRPGGPLRYIPGTKGAPPTQTGGQTGGQPRARTWQDNLSDALLLAYYIQEWIRERRAARATPGGGAGFDWSWLEGLLGGVPQTGGSDVAYVSFTPSAGLSPGYGIMNAGMGGSIWSGIGSALGQIASSAIGNLAMPGGAPIPGLGVPFPTGIAPTGSAIAVRRAPMIIAVGGRAYRSLGTPLAWSGDLAAVKRLRRASARIGKVIPRRGGHRFR